MRSRDRADLHTRRTTGDSAGSGSSWERCPRRRRRRFPVRAGLRAFRRSPRSRGPGAGARARPMGQPSDARRAPRCGSVGSGWCVRAVEKKRARAISARRPAESATNRQDAVRDARPRSRARLRSASRRGVEALARESWQALHRWGRTPLVPTPGWGAVKPRKVVSSVSPRPTSSRVFASWRSRRPAPTSRLSEPAPDAEWTGPELRRSGKLVLWRSGELANRRSRELAANRANARWERRVAWSFVGPRLRAA